MCQNRAVIFWCKTRRFDQRARIDKAIDRRSGAGPIDLALESATIRFRLGPETRVAAAGEVRGREPERSGIRTRPDSAGVSGVRADQPARRLLLPRAPGATLSIRIGAERRALPRSRRDRSRSPENQSRQTGRKTHNCSALGLGHNEPRT